jgi:hypothetical protein
LSVYTTALQLVRLRLTILVINRLGGGRGRKRKTREEGATYYNNNNSGIWIMLEGAGGGHLFHEGASRLVRDNV